MFIIQQRHHYNRAMISTISDCLHYEIAIPQWQAIFTSYLNIFSEKKVEVFHSLLRSQCPSWSKAEQISEFAHVINARKFKADFALNFLSSSTRKENRQNVAHLAGKTAEYLTKTFATLYRNIGQSSEIEGRKRKRKNFKLNRLKCTVDQRCLPLGFSTNFSIAAVRLRVLLLRQRHCKSAQLWTLIS